MRIGEALQIQLNGLEFNDPTRIIVREQYTKTSDTRIVFISAEATETLKEWLKVSQQYIDSPQYTNGLGKDKNTEDDRISPFSDLTYRIAWDNAFTKA